MLTLTFYVPLGVRYLFASYSQTSIQAAIELRNTHVAEALFVEGEALWEKASGCLWFKVILQIQPGCEGVARSQV